jgi:hypothetical protein
MDLRPYVCTSVDCTAPDRLFEDQHRWFEHEMQAHMQWWECIDGCKKPFNSKSAFEDHIRHTHQNLFIGNQLPALVNMSERQVSPKTQIECPLCKEMVPLLPDLRRHLGEHQEQLALFALPSNLEQTEEENESDIADHELAGKEDLASDASRAESEQDKPTEMNLADINRESDLEAAPPVIEEELLKLENLFSDEKEERQEEEQEELEKKKAEEERERIFRVQEELGEDILSDVLWGF